LRSNIIEAVILTGPAKGEIAFIPRIPMIPSDLPFSFKRLQFPVKVSFAITINKAQSQPFKYVGVDLRTECFSYGQLYVAFSRTGDPNHLMISISTENTTKNIIYSEVL
jgi:ATP-dependent DNA helicase PIF1